MSTPRRTTTARPPAPGTADPRTTARLTTEARPHAAPREPRLLTTEQLAEWLQVHPDQLKRMRGKGEGPDYVKHGQLVRYAPTAVVRWLEGNTVRHGAEQ